MNIVFFSNNKKISTIFKEKNQRYIEERVNKHQSKQAW